MLINKISKDYFYQIYHNYPLSQLICRAGTQLATHQKPAILIKDTFMLLQSHALRPLATAHLAHTMTLLGMPLDELRQKVNHALASNPALELLEGRYCPNCHRPLADLGGCPVCSSRIQSSGEEPIVFLSCRQDFQTYSGKTAPEDLPDEEASPEIQDLPRYVLRQIATELKEEERPIAAHLLTSLDEDGLLGIPLSEIARYHHCPIAKVQHVLRLIQRADPVGVGSPTPEEALLIQLEALRESRPVPALCEQAITYGMELLSRRRYHELGSRLGIATKEAKEIAQFIGKNLNPFPGRAHWGDIHHGQGRDPEAYHTPDVIISPLGGESGAPLVVEVIAPFAGRLRLNPLFREALSQAPSDKEEQWQNDYEQAILMVKCLQQRNQAIIRLMHRLVVLQKEFILLGEAHLKPITRAQLAKELEVHESTISRAVAGKSAQMPNGKIVPIAKFFDRSLQVRTALKHIIEAEGNSLSDSDLARLLARQGYPVARRTVAKYRAMEGILPAHLRQPFHAVP
jgi:RNA polymerase sigma-54 factor